jgi:hypothetical protein
VATWSSFIATPPFPDYVSGHSTFSAAAAAVLALFYAADDFAFISGSDALPGVSRSFPGFSAAAAEAALSRIYGGIHYRFPSQDGLNAARRSAGGHSGTTCSPRETARENSLLCGFVGRAF